MDSKTAQELHAAQVISAQYDAMAKVLFSNREILSPVLKEVVSEFKDCTYEEIIQYIDPASIDNTPVDDISVINSGTQTELSSPSEKTIRYDTRFRAVNPKLSSSELQFYLHIDLEVQNDYQPTNPKYPVIKRAIYYGSREISSQLSILEENKTNYDSLQKAYSIWICNENIPKHLINTVTRYTLTRQDVIGHCDEPDADYDLLEIIIIRRGNNEGKETIFDYLTGVFKADFVRLEPYIGKSESTEKLKTEVQSMSGLGMSIYYEGRTEGISIGEARTEKKYAEAEKKYAEAEKKYAAEREKTARYIAELEAQLAALKG